MAISTTYNQMHGARPTRTDSVAPLDVSLQSSAERLYLTGDECCDACPLCADVCRKDCCRLCRAKTGKRRKANVCVGEPTSTMCEIKRHQSPESAWLVADGHVYDVTSYLAIHPGGKNSILKKCGGAYDCSQDLLFHSSDGKKLWRKYRIGKVTLCSPGENKVWWMFWR